jgi:hypothetical protein
MDEPRLVGYVLEHVMGSLGARNAQAERAAEREIADALGVEATQVLEWRNNPHLVPLDYRLALSI